MYKDIGEQINLVRLFIAVIVFLMDVMVENMLEMSLVVMNIMDHYAVNAKKVR